MRFRSSPATFRVEEIPLFAPVGEGEHLWLEAQKSGIDTFAARKRLADWFGCNSREVGYAGLKDAASVAVQHFTLPVTLSPADALALARGRQDECLRVLAACRHAQRLRVGQLAGNRFRAVLEGPPDRAAAIAAALRRAAREGFPNRFGPQRFGRGGRNVEFGRQVLEGRRKGPGERVRLWVSALQAEVFNRVLDRRLREGARILEGDRLVPAGRRSRALKERLASAPGPAVAERRGLTAPSGPLPGDRMRWAEGLAGEIEREEAAAAGWPFRRLGKIGGTRIDGSRRALRAFPWQIACVGGRHSVIVEFSLPAGCYATVLLEELTRAADRGYRTREPGGLMKQLL